MDSTLNSAPPPFRARAGAKARLMRSVPRTCVSNSSCQPSSLLAGTFEPVVGPALLLGRITSGVAWAADVDLPRVGDVEPDRHDFGDTDGLRTPGTCMDLGRAALRQCRGELQQCRGELFSPGRGWRR
ncbi:hypothetical protein [Streptomyces sp. NPDC045470]|uniref:hypothetical protein n=1 Tax=Streptomyces sp. NPDC045470 TaxID=3155469 RepID=UPI0033CF35C3